MQSRERRGNVNPQRVLDHKHLLVKKSNLGFAYQADSAVEIKDARDSGDFNIHTNKVIEVRRIDYCGD